ncbi:MAG TPA: hypothetical protein VK158_02980 [Acidobacteriota bacterium]|nr:hypothetical protein [Acidobacteriota bacterium]
MGIYEKKQKEFKRTIIWLTVVVLLLLAGLIYVIIAITDRAVDIDTADLYKEFQIAVGQTILVNDKSVSITLEEVLSESRCPIDAFCIQAGSASIKLTVQTADDKRTITLATDAQDEPVYVGPYQIRLIQVLPYPGTTQTDVPLEKKTAILIVTPK